MYALPPPPVPALLSPAGGGGHAPRVAGGGLCGRRPSLRIRRSPRIATGRCELQDMSQNPTCKTPPPNRLSPIHPRPRGTGILGAPTSSSAHGSAPPAGDRCAELKSLVFGFLCPPLAGVDTRPAWPGVDCAGRHRGLPLRATKISPRAAAHPDSPCGCVEEGQTQRSAPTRCGNESPRGRPAPRSRLLHRKRPNPKTVHLVLECGAADLVRPGQMV